MKNSQDRTDVRQNVEYTASRKHEANLRRNPTLHFQVGLILALLVAIFFLEVKMPEKAYNLPTTDYDPEVAVWDEQFQVEKKVVEITVPKIEEPAPAQPQLPDEVTPVDDDTVLIESKLEGTSEVESDTLLVDPGVVDYVDTVDEPEEEEVPFRRIEEVPLFPGCEGLDTNDERKACMSSKINKIVYRKFNTSLGEELGLRGINRIYVQFTVDKGGYITKIKTRGPHAKLEKEAERVIKSLPQMQPGKQRSMPVGVVYNLPITFKIED